MLIALLALLWAAPLHAASLDQSRKVVTMVYDVGLYETELDRVMALADGKGVFAGSTPAARARNRMATRSIMLGAREAVLRATIEKVTVRATDPQLNALIRMADSTGSPDPALIDQAVTAVKSSFEEVLWDQIARTARGAAEFPCTREQRSRCL